MFGKPIKVGQAGQDWVVEYYGFDSQVASQLDFAGPASTSPPPTFGKQETLDQVAKIITQFGSLRASAGVRAIQLARSKEEPDGQCMIQLVGPLDPSVQPGGWVLVSIAQKDPANLITRFIGQVFDMYTDYVVTSNAALAAVQVLKVREWSAALRMRVRYDLNTIEAERQKTVAGDLENIQGALGDGSSGSSTQQELLKTIGEFYNPYEFAHLILDIIGSINENDRANRINQLGLHGLKEVAANTPSVPKALLDRLGIKATPARAFATGFARVVSGRQKGPLRNDGTWDGTFDSIDELTDGYEIPVDHPVSDALGMITQSGMSAWDMLNQHTDPSINETFTDLVSVRDSNGKIQTQPVIFVRQRPLLVQAIVDLQTTSSAPSVTDLSTIGSAASLTGQIQAQPTLVQKSPSALEDLTGFSKFDDLPRVRIPEENISRLRLGRTFMNSKNFIRLDYLNPAVGYLDTQTLAQLEGVTSLDPERKRFGSQEMFPQTSYTANPGRLGIGDVDLPKWFRKLRDLFRTWFGYDYLMGYGSLTVRGGDFPITCGFNIQFTIGRIDLVGHVSRISTSVQMTDQAATSTTTEITLERIVAADGSEMKLLDPELQANLSVQGSK